MKFKIEPVQHPGFIPVPDTDQATSARISRNVNRETRRPVNDVRPLTIALYPRTGAMRGTGSITVMLLRMSY
jgi:hypothetical protein